MLQNENADRNAADLATSATISWSGSSKELNHWLRRTSTGQGLRPGGCRSTFSIASADCSTATRRRISTNSSGVTFPACPTRPYRAGPIRIPLIRPKSYARPEREPSERLGWFPVWATLTSTGLTPVLRARRSDRTPNGLIRAHLGWGAPRPGGRSDRRIPRHRGAERRCPRISAQDPSAGVSSTAGSRAPLARRAFPAGPAP